MFDVCNDEPWPIKPVVGSQVAVSDTIGRNGWVSDALARMHDGNNLVCSDPRRLGKTTAGRLLVNRPGGGGAALLIDYEGVTTPTGFLLNTVKAIASQSSRWGKVRKTIARLFDGAEMTAGQFGVELKIKSSQQDRKPIDLLHDVLAPIDGSLDQSELLILVLDEVPVAVRNIARGPDNGPDEAAYLLQQLRNARQSFGRIRWLITGSIGFHHVLRECTDTTAGVIGDLQNIPLGPLSDSCAALLAQCLALGIDRELDGSAEDEVVRVTGGVPF